MTDEQAQDMNLVWGKNNGTGVLDYVTAWYRKAAEYIQGTKIPVSFVSTNSISQGEQVGALWSPLFQRFGLKIQFAHRTFAWESEARGKAHVHVVIIGFGAFDTANKRIFDYDSDGQNAAIANVANISPYLIEGSDVTVTARTKPLCDVPEIIYGSKPVDGGSLILSDEEKKLFLAENPTAQKFIRPFIGSEEFINGIPRWCLWLVGATPQEIRSIPGIKRRVEAVRESRLASKKEPTRRKADCPSLFAEIRQVSSDYLLIPSVSSELRKFIPLGFMSANVIANNLVMFVPGATHFHFGVLTSSMHTAWTKQVCGRLKSDVRYSNKLVYNNFPWPEAATEKHRAAVEAAAQEVLDARASFPSSTLADLYDPLAMPPALVKAHAKLDRAVDLCYRPQIFANDRQRVEYLFALYEKLTAPLIPATKKSRRKKS